MEKLSEQYLKMAQSIEPSDFACNCGACGEEHMNTELKEIVLRGLDWKLKLCKACQEKDPFSNYNEAYNAVKG